jgi:hypothetical protein
MIYRGSARVQDREENMYYRDDFGCGCAVAMLSLFVILSLFFNPYFWIVVIVIAAVSAIQQAIEGRRMRKKYEDGQYTYGGRGDGPEQHGNGESGPQPEKTDAEILEDDYETGAVDVDVEVIHDDDGDE